MSVHKDQKGFTIVELLIAAIIIAVGILGWAKAQDGSIKGRAVSNGITTASELGMAKLEQLALECQDNAAAEPAGGPEDIISQGVRYERTWTIEADEILDGVSLWKIEVTVSWNHYGPTAIQYQRIVVGG
ncbi:MAG: prepilin-type N-terminal cleavage/methylation domain-containing protein [Desulfomicrobium sp.]